jgi:hypothetical protein
MREDDPERASLAAVLGAWSRDIGTGFAQRTTAPKLLGNLSQYPELQDALAATAPNGKLTSRSLGYWLRQYKGRVVGNLLLAHRPDPNGHPAEWYVEAVGYPTTAAV